MKVIHGLGIASALVSIVLGVAGFTVAAGILLGMTVGVELAAAALTGKQTNAGSR